MGLDERDYVRGKHPPTCACVECCQRRPKQTSLFGDLRKRQKILSVSRRRHAQISFKPLIVWLITVGLVLGTIFALGCPVAPEPIPEYPPTQPVITPEPTAEYPPTEPVITPEPAPECPPSEPVITPEPAPEPAIEPKPGPRDIVEEANFEAIDYHALNVPGLGWECIESLAAYLTEPARNDLEIARAISRWIVQNISYDMEYLLDDTFRRDQSAKATLLRGYAVCEGYARLFEALACAAGLKVEYLTGWATGFGHDISEPVGDHLYHAWNAVRIDGGWYLLDVTWADKDYCGQFKEFYFLTCPTELIYSHFPRNPDWQLREIPISKQEFTELPRLEPAFFQKGLELVTHTQSVIKTEQQVTINIMVPADILLLVELSQDDQNLPRRLTFAERKGDIYQIDAVFPQPGEYTLNILAGRKQENGYFEWGLALRYKIIVSKGIPGPIGFPVVAQAFFEYGLDFDSHTQGVIEVDYELTVTLQVPENILLLVELSQDDQELPRRLTFVQRKGEKYRIDVVFPYAGDYILRVFAKDKDEEELFVWVLDYKIIVSQGMPGPIGFPVVGRAFFEYGLDFDSHTQGIIEVDYQLTVTLQVPENILLLVELSQDDQELPRRLTFIQRKGDIYQIDAVFPQAGEYILRFFAGKKQENVSFEWALDYKIIVSEGMTGPIGFPKTFGTFHEREVFLYTPRSGYLQSGTTEQFKLRVPGAQSVAVRIGDQRHHLTKYADLFKGVVDIVKGQIVVVVRFPDDPHCYFVLKYTGF
ncbi:hypothetical protein M1O12_02355 [Dehalococcoidia bacterium]|nr:hypothetical protein [Dehalococcoidia bacterium]